MPAPRITLLDVALAKGHDRAVGLIEESIATVPEIGVFPVKSIAGTYYDTLVRTGLPTASWTAGNTGVAASKSTLDRRRVECFLLQSRIEMAKHITDATEEGAAWWQAMESLGAATAALRLVSSQIYYGTTAGALGFSGFKAATPVSGASGIVTNATGATSTTASSAYFVKFGPQGVNLVAGRNATLELSNFMEESIEDASGLKLPGYVGHLHAWMGLQLTNTNAVSRIYNLTEDSGKGLTDALIATHLAKLKDGYDPDMILMSRRSRRQLQHSRTSVINAGPGSAKPDGSVGNVGPIPTEAFGIPIMVSDSILNTDAIDS